VAAVVVADVLAEEAVVIEEDADAEALKAPCG